LTAGFRSTTLELAQEVLMPVDPTKPRVILIVHGVQTGDNEGADRRDDVRDLVESRAPNLPIQFETQMFQYEDLNDQALNRYKKLAAALSSTPVGAVLAPKLIDLAGDVVISVADGTTAAKIRARLRARIEEFYEAGNPCYVLAHSLGSIYAFDVVSALIKDEKYFKRGSRKNWPVQGLVTIGSPIGLGMFRGRRKAVAKLGEGTKMLRWLNYWDRTDPVVSGQIFGTQLRGNSIAERYQTANADQGWVIRDFPMDTGTLWLKAHSAYWTHSVVGDGLHMMITS
jgi:hypothetical protein